MPQANNNTETKKKLALEICVDSVQSALAAEVGGAQRVELCNSLSEGGTTPSAGMIEVVRKNIGIGVHVLIRPRRGDFLFSRLEFEAMKKDIELAKKLGADGVVLGMLRENGSIDRERMEELILLSRPLHVTFHRAFDLTPDPYQALEDLIQLKVDRLLTSGQQKTALQGAPLISDLVCRAAKQLVIMPGGGINPANIQEIIEKTAATAFHSSARSKIKSPMRFQRDQLSMAGAQTLTEYEHLVTDPEQVLQIRQACNRME